MFKLFALLLVAIVALMSATQVQAAGWHFDAEQRRDLGVPAHKRMLAYYGRRLKSKNTQKTGLRRVNKGASDPWAELL